MPENQNPGQKSHSHEAIPFQLPGRAMSIWRSLGSDILAQNWKSMWKPYIVSILYFIKKRFLLVIFWTLFSKKCHFLPILAKFLILPEYIKVIIKSCSKYHIYFTFVQLLIITLNYLGKHRNFAKSGKNWPFFTKQSPKNE